MGRRVKLVCTLGPATAGRDSVRSLAEAGTDVFRVNMSHGDPDAHAASVRDARAAAEALGRELAVMADLPGPKIRLGELPADGVWLEPGARFDLRADDVPGDASGASTTYAGLAGDLEVGDRVLLADGAAELLVRSVRDATVTCEVVRGGHVRSRAGVNVPAERLGVPAITDRDRRALASALELEVDLIAQSFVRAASDVADLRTLMGDRALPVVAKIETRPAVEAIDEVLRGADAIMVARGDLGVEIGDAELPGVQKRLIRLARGADRAVITATQMMQSMVNASLPTRAEVLDVANAVIDGTDAVMLSEETAVGRYPVEAVAAMARICEGAERQREAMIGGYRTDEGFTRVDESIAMAAMYVANRLPVKAIAALTESGDTALWMSRVGSGIPIYALTPHRQTLRRVTLYRGVYPVAFTAAGNEPAAINAALIEVLRREGVVAPGDLVIATKGDLTGVHGGTSALKILQVGAAPAAAA